MTKVYTGKSKDIYKKDENTCILKFKNQMQAADGRFFLMENKARVLNNINSIIFEFLSKKNIPHHYLGKDDEESFLAKTARPLPLECVVRRFAEGSYLKRNPDIETHHVFEDLVFEVFYKDDELNDPYIQRKEGKLFLYDQTRSIDASGLIKEVDDIAGLDWDALGDISKRVFLLLEKELKKVGGILCDFKLEFGLCQGNLTLIDSIEPDGWRLWDGDPGNNLDRNDGYDRAFSESVQNSIRVKYDMAEKFIEKAFA